MNTKGNSKETLACLVIDDPILKPKYGCLDYAQLLEAMKTHNFFTEVAFIPWNYRRSDPRTVRLFADNADYYGICVHGCNHLGNEFGGDNYQELSALASAALWRMDEHKRLTGLSYDPVIVFPQGRFSSVAMKAVKDLGYLAAFNSTIKATDKDEPPAIEYQHPATMIYYDLPLFLRRYPHNKPGLIQDMESGRPIIIVEHHTAFRSGYKDITSLVDWVNQLGKVRWTSLLNIAKYYTDGEAAVTKPIVNTPPSRLQWNPKIITRRVLSEARDNYVENESFP